MKVVRLNLGGLCRVRDFGLGEPRGESIATQKSAEGIVGEVHRRACPTYSAPKARTVPAASVAGKWNGNYVTPSQ